MLRQEEEVLFVLLRRLWEQGLISEAEYHGAGRFGGARRQGEQSGGGEPPWIFAKSVN
jgi:hypothetical protein